MAKPKAKSDEEKKAALDQMLSMAATSNHLDNTSLTQADNSSVAQPTTDAPADLQLQKEEQKGENVSLAPTNEAAAPTAPESTPTPAPETPTPAQVSPPAPAVEPTSVAPAPEQVASPVAVAPSVEDTSADEPMTETAPEPTASVDAGNFDLASLFLPATEKKTAQMRLTDSHYQYLLLLGTIVGGGTPPPDIVHNLVQQFIDKHDAQVQKAIAKQMRQRQAKK